MGIEMDIDVQLSNGGETTGPASGDSSLHTSAILGQGCQCVNIIDTAHDRAEQQT